MVSDGTTRGQGKARECVRRRRKRPLKGIPHEATDATKEAKENKEAVT